MKLIDNIHSTLKDDIIEVVKKGDKISVAAAVFSMYAYSELKKELESLDEFRFIFTAPMGKLN